MTNENEKKKEYLSRYRDAVMEEGRLEEDLRIFRINKMSPSMSYDDMPHGSSQSDMSDYVAKLDEKISRCIKKKKECIEVYADIRNRIEQIEDNDERDVLTYRYMRLTPQKKYRSWERICCDMGMEWAQVHRIHARALKNFLIKK